MVAEAFHQVKLVGGEQHGHTAGGEGVEDLEHLLDGVGVQAAERFVQHQAVGLEHHGGSDLDTLLVAQGEFLQLVLQSLAQSEAGHQFRRGVAGLGGGHAVELAQIHELPEHRLLRVQATLLGHVAHPGSHLAVDRPAVPQHITAGGFQQTHDHAHGGGLARTVAPHESGERAGWDDEGNIVDCGQVAEDPGQISYFKHVHSSHHQGSCAHGCGRISQRAEIAVARLPLQGECPLRHPVGRSRRPDRPDADRRDRDPAQP